MLKWSIKFQHLIGNRIMEILEINGNKRTQLDNRLSRDAVF